MPQRNSVEAVASRPDSISIWEWAIAIGLCLYFWTPLAVMSPLDPVVTAVLIGPGLASLVLLGCRRLIATTDQRVAAVTIAIMLLLLIGPAAIGSAVVMLAFVARRWGFRLLTFALAGGVVLAKLGGLIIIQQLVLTEKWTQASSYEFTFTLTGVVIALLVGARSRAVSAEMISRHAAVAATAEAEAARIDAARTAERERIAREMHDVLAHRLSLVAMHAGALAYRTDLDPETSRETAALIQTNAKKSLAELRMVLSDLRGADGQPEPPQPTMIELDQLIAETGNRRVHVECAVTLADLPDQLSRHAYRIVQEGLTNARRHAPGSPVTLEIIGTAGDHLHIAVRNRLTDLAPATPGSGLGSVGIAERVELLGGQLHQGVVDDHYLLSASLPWRMAE